MSRRAEQHFARGCLYQAPGAHNGDPVSNIIDHGQVVRNKQIGQPQVFLEILHKIEDLRLHRDIKRRDRFVAYQQFRFECQGAGDADALALSAGERVRIAVQVARIETDQRHQLLHHLGTVFLIADLMDNQWLRDDIKHRHPRVQRRERILEHELHLAPIGQKFLFVQLGQINDLSTIVEQHLTGIRPQGTHYHFRQGRLAASGFANQAQAFALAHEKADIVDRQYFLGFATGEQTALAQLIRFGEAVHLKQRGFKLDRLFFPLCEQVTSAMFDLAQRYQAFAGFHVKPWHCAQKCAQVIMSRRAENIVQRSTLQHPAMIHHDDFIGDVRDHTKVMGDHQDGHLQFGLQIVQQFQYLRLNGHVERRCRLIRDQQRRAADKRHRDHRALTQPAGQFERIGPQGPLRIGKTDQAQHFRRQFHTFGFCDLTMQEQRFGNLIAHRVQRRQRCHWFLKDDRYPPATDCAHSVAVLIKRQQVGDRAIMRIAKHHLTGSHLGRFGQNTHDGLRDDGLAGAGLADQRHGFTRRHAKAHAVYGADDALGHVEFDLKVVNV